MEKLEPCPYCGGEGVRVDLEDENAVAIECEKCGAGTGRAIHAKDDAWPHAVFLWNRREGMYLAQIVAESARKAARAERRRAAKIIDRLLNCSWISERAGIEADAAWAAARAYVREAEAEE